MIVNGISIKHDGISEEEMKFYIDYILEHAPKGTTDVTCRIDGEDIECKYEYVIRKDFERIRRITGYLVGTLDRWNDAKRAEEHDRVKHNV